jgi:hypothetical protein
VVTEHLHDDRLDGLTRIGVDEIASSGHRYLTVVVDQAGGNVIWGGGGDAIGTGRRGPSTAVGNARAQCCQTLT